MMLEQKCLTIVMLLGICALCTYAQNYDLYDNVDDDVAWRSSQQLPYPFQQQQQQPHQLTQPHENTPVAAYPELPQPDQTRPENVYQPRPPIPQDFPSPIGLYVPRLGSVRGRNSYKIINNRPINAYFGLKYGKVGRGIARFQEATVPDTTPISIIDATSEPKNCPQWPDLERVVEREANGENVNDCLTLNIFSPAQARSLPVFVYVHGEMLFDGSAEEGQPDYFLEHDVVFVSINYRLAPFGFLTTLSDNLPGNIALSDIHLALKWVNQNIQSFGGDPEQVTLFGQAAGASLVHALSLSGKANGLFHKLILQSGTALNPYFIDENPINSAKTFAQIAPCPTMTLENLDECFSRLGTTELLLIFKKLWDENEKRGLTSVGGFKLVVGDKLGYLPQHPAALIANNQNNVPIIAGVAKDAGAFIFSRFYDQLETIRFSNISDYVNIVLRHIAQPRDHQLWHDWSLREIFSVNDIQNPTLRGLTQGLLELVNVILYRGPVVDSIRYSHKTSPTYLYMFDYRGEFHRFGHLSNPLPFGIDATLSDDNIYLFPYPEEVSELNAEDKTIARAFTTMWVNFGKHSVPNLNDGVWPRASSEYGPFLRITNSRDKALEVDYKFTDGLTIPNLYPEYLKTTSTTSTTIKPTIQPNPYYHNYGQNNYPVNPYYRQSNREGGYPSYQQQSNNQNSVQFETTSTTTTLRPYAYYHDYNQNPYYRQSNRQGGYPSYQQQSNNQNSVRLAKYTPRRRI